MELWKKFLRSSYDWNLKNEVVNEEKGDHKGLLCHIEESGLYPMRGVEALERFKQRSTIMIKFAF